MGGYYKFLLAKEFVGYRLQVTGYNKPCEVVAGFVVVMRQGAQAVLLVENHLMCRVFLALNGSDEVDTVGYDCRDAGHDVV